MDEEKVIDIRVNIGDGLSRINQITEEVNDLTAAMKEEEKQNGKNTDSYRAMQKQVIELKNEKQVLSREVTNEIKSNQESLNAYERLKSEYALAAAAAKNLAVSKGVDNEETIKAIATADQMANQLKEVESVVGQNQRKVGEYENATKGLRTQMREMTEALAAMEMQGKNNTEEYRNLVAKAGELRDAMGDASAAINATASDTSKFDAAMGAASLSAAGFSVVTGAMEAFGAGSEQAAEAQKKLQSAMAITMGLTEIQNQLQKQSALMLGLANLQTSAGTVATKLKTAAESENIIVSKAATIAQAAFNKIAAANPYVLLALAITTVVGALVLFASGTGKAKEEQAALNYELQKTKGYMESLQRDYDLEIRLMQARGESELKVLEAQRKAANERLIIAQKGKDAVLDNANATKEQKEEAIKVENDAYLALRKINDDITVYNAKSIADRKKQQEDAEKASREAASKRRAEEVRDMENDLKIMQAKNIEITEQTALDEFNLTKSIVSRKRQYRLISEKEYQLEMLNAESEYQSQITELANKAYDQEIDRLSLRKVEIQAALDERLRASGENYEKEYQAKSAALIADRDLELSNSRLTEVDRLQIEADYKQRSFELDEEYKVAIAERDAIDFENRLSIAEGNIFAEFNLKKQGLERSRVEELQNAEKTGADKALINAKYNRQEVELEKTKTMAKLSLASGFMGNLATIFGEGTKAGKIFASSQIAIDTIKGAMAAYSSMAAIPVIGPALGIAAAAAVGVMGAKSIKDVWAVSENGVQAPPSVASSSAASTPDTTSKMASVISGIQSTPSSQVLSGTSEVASRDNQSDIITAAVIRGMKEAPAPQVSVKEIRDKMNDVQALDNLASA